MLASQNFHYQSDYTDLPAFRLIQSTSYYPTNLQCN